MPPTNAIINPVKGRKDPQLAPLVIFVSSIGDMKRFTDLLGFTDAPFTAMMTSRVYAGEHLTLAGPVTGAPYAAIVMENLIAWGASRFIYVGWCGAIVPTLAIGDILVPRSAIADEGTTPGYGGHFGQKCFADEPLTCEMEAVLLENGIDVKTGAIWTTDAIFRETPEKLNRFASQRAMAVEMELSALFYISGFRGVALASVMIVSDELATLTWTPGFKSPKFRQRRNAVAEAICSHVERFQ